MDTERLQAAESAYSGDFCAEDRHSDWAVALREEARAAYLAVVRTLIRSQVALGEHVNAVRYLLRLLACEPDDEQAHLMLVRELDATGRHGEARRTYRAYATRMAERDVESAPYPEAGAPLAPEAPIG